MAAEWLTFNIKNRNMRDSRVTSYQGMLVRDEWKLTGDAAVFDENGHLINGQHRLRALADLPTTHPDSGVKSIRFVVLRGVPAEAQDVMDANLPRKLSDALKLRGGINNVAVAAALNCLHKYRYVERTGNVNYSDPGERASTLEALRLLDENPGLPNFYSRTEPVRKNLHVRTGMGMALYHIFDQIDSADAEAFMESLSRGTKVGDDPDGPRVSLLETDPIFQLRRFFLNIYGITAGRPPWYREAAMICKAWNLWRDGRQIGSLAWKYGGKNHDPFPLAK